MTEHLVIVCGLPSSGNLLGLPPVPMLAVDANAKYDGVDQ